MKPILFLLTLLTGCATLPENTRQPHTAQERAAQTARRAEDATLADAARKLAAEKRQTQHEQTQAGEQLRAKFKRYTTPELQIMRTRYAALVNQTRRLDADINPAHAAIWGTPHQRNFDRLIEIERELLRRHHLGDEAAHIPTP